MSSLGTSPRRFCCEPDLEGPTLPARLRALEETVEEAAEDDASCAGCEAVLRRFGKTSGFSDSAVIASRSTPDSRDAREGPWATALLSLSEEVAGAEVTAGGVSRLEGASAADPKSSVLGRAGKMCSAPSFAAEFTFKGWAGDPAGDVEGDRSDSS